MIILPQTQCNVVKGFTELSGAYCQLRRYTYIPMMLFLSNVTQSAEKSKKWKVKEIKGKKIRIDNKHEKLILVYTNITTLFNILANFH